MAKQLIFSQGMQLSLKLLFLALFMMAILPWIGSATPLGSFFLTFYGIAHFFPATQQNFSDSYYHFNSMTRILGMLGSLICLSPLFIGLILMLRVCKNYTENNVFSYYNAAAFSKLGILYLLSALVLQPVSQMFFSFAISLTYPPLNHHYSISFGLDTNNITALIFSLLLIISGQIMKKAYHMAEEQKLVI